MTTREHVFRPASVLPQLPREASMSGARHACISRDLDAIHGDGLPCIRAKNRLIAGGRSFIPIAVNRLLLLDYSRGAANLYAFEVATCVEQVVDFEAGLEYWMPGREFDLRTGHRNALRVWQLYEMTREHWSSAESLRRYGERHSR